jgi:hypothetical protein
VAAQLVLLVEARSRIGAGRGAKGGKGWGEKEISPFQPVIENWKAVTCINCNCISPESPGRRLIECYFCLERAYREAEQHIKLGISSRGRSE